MGVVEDVRENGVDQVSPATVYWPSLMDDPSTPEKLGAWRTVYFAIRSNRAGTQAFINEMQQAVWSVNANLPVADVEHHAGYLWRFDGADFVHAGDAGNCGNAWRWRWAFWEFTA